MGQVLWRLTLLTVGFTLLELWVPPALVLGGWDWMVVAGGLILIAAGTAGFMIPLFASRPEGRSRVPR